MTISKSSLTSIVIDKLFIALLLAAFGFWTNGLLARQKSDFEHVAEEQRSANQKELELMRAAIAQQGALASRRISAYEQVWSTATAFLRFDEDLGDVPLNKNQVDSLTRLHQVFEAAVWNNFPFIDDSTRSDLGVLVEGFRPSIGPDGRQRPVPMDVFQRRSDLAQSLYVRMQAAASLDLGAVLRK